MEWPFALDRSSFKVVNYIDGIVWAEKSPWSTLVFTCLGELLSSLELIKSVAKTCPPILPCIAIWGIVFDMVAGTLNIPHSKLDEILWLLRDWSHHTRTTKRGVQSVVCSDNFLVACIRPDHVYKSRLLNFLHSMPDARSISLNPEFHQDIMLWHNFSPHFNITGVAMMLLSDWSIPDGVVLCNACLMVLVWCLSHGAGLMLVSRG